MAGFELPHCQEGSRDPSAKTSMKTHQHSTQHLHRHHPRQETQQSRKARVVFYSRFLSVCFSTSQLRLPNSNHHQSFILTLPVVAERFRDVHSNRHTAFNTRSFPSPAVSPWIMHIICHSINHVGLPSSSSLWRVWQPSFLPPTELSKSIYATWRWS